MGRSSVVVNEQVDHCIVGDGIEVLQAAFERHVFERHMHDTFAIGFTMRGVQRFWCRGRPTTARAAT